MQTMRDLLEEAGTIVFVSHTLPSVAEFCNRTMWLDRGRIRTMGESEDVVEEYLADVTSLRSEPSR
jgi:ABC-type polysaccharide/polyol phosphate transport system ATPase subunit